ITKITVKKRNRHTHDKFKFLILINNHINFLQKIITGLHKRKIVIELHIILLIRRFFMSISDSFSRLSLQDPVAQDHDPLREILQNTHEAFYSGPTHPDTTQLVIEYLVPSNDSLRDDFKKLRRLSDSTLS